jgi:4-diphosphocytidyl-2-C-methyl-D-erythritol kinase
MVRARARRTQVSQLSFSLPSFAKINWSLQILGKRPDGYHEVKTVLQTISLHDDLHFELSGDGAVALSCDDPEIPTDDRNLIIRAAYALKDRYQVDLGARVRLRKRIPAKAGLGGASSNAAVTLLALSQIWQVAATLPSLLELAANLGADVPFFLLGGRTLATGTGATVSPLPDTDSGIQQLIVITPNASVATVDAYAALSSTALTTLVTDPILSSSRKEAISESSAPWPPYAELNNDFESVIFDIEPEIRRAKEMLLQAGAFRALLAGSGSSVFGIFTDQEAQQRAIDEIRSEPGWRVFPCVTLSRNEYVSAFDSGGISFLRSFNLDF